MKWFLTFTAAACLLSFAVQAAPAPTFSHLVLPINSAYSDFNEMVLSGVTPLISSNGSRRALTHWQFAQALSLTLSLTDSTDAPAPTLTHPFHLQGTNGFETIPSLPMPMTQINADRRSYQQHLIADPPALAALTRPVQQFQSVLQVQGVDTALTLTNLARFRASIPPFPDVPKTHWAYRAVTRLRHDGILIGDPNGRNL